MHRFIETVGRRGYRFIASVDAVTPGPSPSGRRLGRNVRNGLAAVGLSLIIGGLAWQLASGERTRAPGEPPAIRSIVVLPLANLSNDPESEYFADGMTDALITDLAGIRTLRVISRQSAMAYKNSAKRLPDIARELGVDAVVEGSIAQSGNGIRLSAQLVHGPTDRHLWARSYERRREDALMLQRTLTQAIVAEIRVALTERERTELSRVPDVRPAVYDAYLRGGHLLAKRTEADTRKAIEYFERAIKEDGNYAPAWAGLGEAYAVLGTIQIAQPPRVMRPQALAAANRALELDPTLSSAHAIVGKIKFHDFEWREADEAYRRALELRPGDAQARAEYALTLAARGDFDVAIAEATRAWQLDPLSPLVRTWLGWILELARRYDDALGHYRAILELEPRYSLAHHRMGFAYVAKGEIHAAIPAFERAVETSEQAPSTIAWLGYAEALSGRRVDARRRLRGLLELARTHYVPPVPIAYLYLGLGHRDEALAWLDRAVEERSTVMAFVKVHATFDPLREDPRFKNLLARMKLEPQ